MEIEKEAIIAKIQTLELKQSRIIRECLLSGDMSALNDLDLKIKDLRLEIASL